MRRIGIEPRVPDQRDRDRRHGDRQGEDVLVGAALAIQLGGRVLARRD